MAFCNNNLHQIQWSKEQQCSLPYGTCDNNQCICEKGFNHDLFLYRYRDCKVPNYFLPIIDGITLFFTLVGLIYFCMNIRASRNLARKIILSAAALNMFYLIYLILKFSDSHLMTGKSLFFFQLTLSSLFLCWYLVVYSLMQPICSLLRLPMKGKTMAMVISFVVFRVIVMSITLYAIIKVDNPNDVNNDLGWNNAVAAAELISAMEIGCLSFGTMYNGVKMITEIKKIIVKTSSANKSFSDYTPRVQRIVNLHALHIVTFSLGIISPVIQIATGYLPYSYAIFSIIEFAFPFVSYKFGSFAVVNKHVGELSDKNQLSKNNSAEVAVVPTNKEISTMSSFHQQTS